MNYKKHFKPFGILAFAFVAFSTTNLWAQSPPNWQNLDYKTDNIIGVSTAPAYKLLEGKTSQKIIVAVIDGGTDTIHEDLKSVLWNNPKEIAGNGIDDDNNGYIDDIHGWNFIGGKSGNVKEDNLEITRVYRYLSAKYKNTDEASATDKKEYKYYLSVKKDFESRRDEAVGTKNYYEGLLNAMENINNQIGKEDITVEDLEKISPDGPFDLQALEIMKGVVKGGGTFNDLKPQLEGAINHFSGELAHHLNVDFDPRNIVGDNYTNSSEKNYGNADVMGYGADHGTHVAGIIAAIRGNNLGIEGIANNVEIMIVRVVPDGDERDKDVANGIRYAVDNGAKVINMSFGKDYSFDKKAVDDAVKYAESKDVLLVHAAGNSSLNLDKENNFPNKRYEDGGYAKNWIEVGASTFNYDEKLAAEFSNYGRKNVDVFAPGYLINSTIPDSKYAEFSGTSMAAPVVAGVAALLRSYFPTLTAPEILEIIMKSSTPVKMKVTIPGEEKKKTKFKKLSKSGGVANVNNAVELCIKKTK